MLFALSLHNYITLLLPYRELLYRICITVLISIMQPLLALWYRDLFSLVFKQLDWHPYVYFKLRLVHFIVFSFPDTWKVILHLFLPLFPPVTLSQKVFLKFSHILLLYNVGLALANVGCTKWLSEVVLQLKLFYDSMELSNS